MTIIISQNDIYYVAFRFRSTRFLSIRGFLHSLAMVPYWNTLSYKIMNKKKESDERQTDRDHEQKTTNKGDFSEPISDLECKYKNNVNVL